MNKQVDITENVAGGDVAHIISILNRFIEVGFDRLYWDGYDSSIYLYKSNQPERSKREDSNKFYVLWQIGPNHVPPTREGELNSKKEAQKWVDDGIAKGLNRFWHEHSRDAVL